MDNYFEVHNIYKIEHADEGSYLELLTDSDFEYSFVINQEITVTTDTGKKYKGVLSAIEDTYFRIQTDNGDEITVTYFETEGIIGKPYGE